MLKYLLLIGMGLLNQCSLMADAENTLWRENFSEFKLSDSAYTGWKATGISAEIIQGNLRIRESGSKSWGSIYHYVKYKNDFGYLQIKLGQIEDVAYSISVNNASTGGQSFGHPLSGINTFSMKGQDFKNKSGKFALSFLQIGPNGVKKGGWLDIESISMVKTPYNGLTMDLQQKNEQTDNIARIGDEILFRCWLNGPSSQKNIQVRCYYAKWMEPYNLTNRKIVLCDDGTDGDQQANDGIYSCVRTITDKTQALTTSNKRGDIGLIVAKACVNGESTYGFSSFGFDIKSKIKLSRTNIVAGTPLTRENRELWLQRTSGQNLALGKKVKMSRKPNYSLTKKGGTDKTDLTDGVLANSGSDRIWYCGETVGYRKGAALGINFLIDLEKSEPVEKLVFRCLGGKASSNLRFPKNIKAYVSMDGKTFYQTASLAKLMPAEAPQSDFKRFFYLNESGEAYVYPFELNVNAQARYVLLNVIGESGWFMCDEIAVLKASPESRKTLGFGSAYKTSIPKAIYFDGVVIAPRDLEFPVPSNIYVPTLLRVQDMRSDEDSEKIVKLTMELPEGISILTKNKADIVSMIIDGEKYRRWTMPYNVKSKPYLFFRKTGTIPKNAKATFYATYDGAEPVKTKVPIKIVKFPDVPKFNKLQISFAWMGLGHAMPWPDFFDSWGKLGFNIISTFPRYWGGKTLNDKIVFLAKARQQGFKILMNSSPGWGRKRYKPEQNSKFEKGFSKNLCPSYTGKYYKRELERISTCAKQSHPDFVFFDIEIWHAGIKEANRCERCLEKRKSSEKPMPEFLFDCGTRHMKDLCDAVKNCGVNGENPFIALYDSKPMKPAYQIYKFQELYPKYIKQAQPSLYVSGDVQIVHDSIRKNHNLLNKKDIVPWLTGGAYGEFPPRKIEFMILEAFLNGACGITYCHFWDFDTPMDFYYHAKALAEIAPYEDLIVEGDVLDITGTNKQLTYSAIRNKNEMLLLVGNYTKTKQTETRLVLPFKNCVIKDLRENKLVEHDNPLILKVPSDDVRFLYIKSK